MVWESLTSESLANVSFNEVVLSIGNFLGLLSWIFVAPGVGETLAGFPLHVQLLELFWFWHRN